MLAEELDDECRSVETTQLYGLLTFGFGRKGEDIRMLRDDLTTAHIQAPVMALLISSWKWTEWINDHQQSDS